MPPQSTAKIAGATLLMGLFIGTAAAKYTMPPKIVETRVEVTKEVYKENKNVKTEIHEIKKTDGTIEKFTTVEDKGVIENSKKSQIKDVVTVDNRDRYMVNALYSYDFKEKKEIYGILAQKRVLLNVYVGASAQTDGTVGLTLGASF